MADAVRLYERLGFGREAALDIEARAVLDAAGPDGPLVIAYRLDLAPDTYVLGRSAAETRRLILQHQVYAPITRQLLTSAGITRAG
jgi:hypothetical protein